MSEHVGLLFVCHANICRSPLAERLSRTAIRPSAAVAVTSAGTHAIHGAPMHPNVARVLQEFGADSTAFVSRPLRPESVAAATVVLTATRSQRAAAVRLVPGAVGKAFTILQFGRLAVDVGDANAPTAGDRVAQLLRAVAVARGGRQPAGGRCDDLQDPVDGSVEDVRDCARHICRAIRPLWTVIGAR